MRSNFSTQGDTNVKHPTSFVVLLKAETPRSLSWIGGLTSSRQGARRYHHRRAAEAACENLLRVFPGKVEVVEG